MNTRGAMYRVWVVLGAVLLVVLSVTVAVVVPWRIQQQKIDTLNKQIAVLQSQSNEPNRKTEPIFRPVQQIFTSQKGVKMLLYTPAQDVKISSPLAVLGEIPGNWSSEALFPVTLRSDNGTIIATSSANILGDWMTDALVPFSVKMTFTSAPSGDGTLVLRKDNPSGLEANDDTIEIPVHFQ